ncbi:MAG TPA: nuclear transport factor 2 family protein [Pyrinomonadaceae bacterium]
MNRLSLAVLALVLLGGTPALAQQSEEAAVREAIEHYFRGQATGQGEHFRKVFHADAKLFFIRDGKVTQWTAEEYISRASGKPADDEAQRKRAIDSVDISGNAAFVKLTLDYPKVVFTDYMSMLKVDGRWVIVNKTFHAKPRT